MVLMNTDPLAVFEHLAAQANEEVAPTIDVTDRVLVILHSRDTAPVALECEYEYFWIQAASLLAGCAASIAFWIGYSDDSLWTLAQPFITVLQ